MKPDSNEYAPYYQRYIDLVSGPVLQVLHQQLADFTQFIRTVPSGKADFAYAPGKWTVKEVVGHMIDTERIMACRALRIARGDTTPLPGFDQDDYVARGHFTTRHLTDLADEFEALRRSDLLLFGTFDEASSLERGTASGNPVSVRALMHIIAGHTLHHQDILKYKYTL